MNTMSSSGIHIPNKEKIQGEQNISTFIIFWHFVLYVYMIIYKKI